MKKVLASLIMVCSVGCASAHTADRIDNASTAAAYDIALEQCVEAAMKAVQLPGADKTKIRSDYEACASAADKKFGRVTQ